MEIQKANTSEQLMQQQNSLINVDTLKLTVIEKEIALACQGERIKDIDIGRITLFMIGLIGKTFLNTGGDFEKNKELIDSTVDELCADLKKYNSNLTLAEIELAFKNGWKKQYGDFFGLNNATYFGWVNAYTWGESRSRAKKAIEDSKKQAQVKPELSELEKEAIIEQGAINCFNHFKNTGILLDVGNITYRFLWEKKMINHSQEVKDDMLIRVKERLRHEESMKLQDRNYIGQHNAIRHELDQIASGKSSKLINEGKRESLKIYFQHLIEMEMDLKDEL